MRVISGKFKGCILKMPKGVKIRPTSQKVKEALFSILGEGICGSSFLELFAGSANIGIEALSRGAKKVFFVENNRSCIDIIKTNLRALDIPFTYKFDEIASLPTVARNDTKRVSVVLMPIEAERALELLGQKKQKFDFVFLDPPYYQDELKNCLIKACRYDILNARSYVIAEHSSRQILPDAPAELRLMFIRKYGDTALSFYQKGVKR